MCKLNLKKKPVILKCFRAVNFAIVIRWHAFFAFYRFAN